MTTRGIRLVVLRPVTTGATADPSIPSNTVPELTLLDERMPRELFAPAKTAPAYVLYSRIASEPMSRPRRADVSGITVHSAFFLVPLGADALALEASGNFAFSLNEMFSRITGGLGYAVPIHDRRKA